MITNWKTTLAGLAAGIPVGIDALVQAYNAGAFNGKTGAQLAAAIGIVLIGLFSKDHDVTGGSRPNRSSSL